MKNISTITKNIKRRVLVVEDEFINQQILGHIVSSQYDVLYASNGKEALDVLNKNERISCILLDLNMPVMNGYEFLNEIKKTNYSRIPIIVLTAEKDAEIESLKLGAQDFIVKPYDMPEIILARINRSIMLYEESTMIEKTARDSLSKLFTLKYFFEYIEEFNAVEDSSMDAIIIDIARFHLINEIYSHRVGDKLLVVLANSIKSLFEEDDGILSRNDGDIFYLYISHLDDYEKFRNEILNNIHIPELNDFDLEIHMGVYPNVNKDFDIRDVFDKALTACRLSKKQLNQYIQIYDEQIQEKELFEEKLIHEFDNALKEKQFKIYLQPKMDITNNEPKLVGAEALVRWISPKYGFINPGVFIPLFENNGLIYRLDEYIWNEVGLTIYQWKKQYQIDFPISVNVSRIDILYPEFRNNINKVITDNHIEYSDLHLEITESAYAKNVKDIHDIVSDLHEQNFKIEIDDFGTGYSSLSLITSIPFDVLKIDMSFIRNMFKASCDLKCIELIINIAKSIGVKTVAEGVEDIEQVNKLKELGCDIVQGYYFSKPIPTIEFEEKYLRRS